MRWDVRVTVYGCPLGNAVVMDRKGIEPSSELYSSVNERKKASTLVLYYVT